MIHLSPDLELDADYFGGGTFALLAKKGAGKSYTARVIAEELWDNNVPFVLLDPMGTSWGLRSSADGKGAGVPVVVIGGKHGDVPLERGGGKVIADLVCEEGISMVLDMSELGSRAAEREFAHAFLERMYRRNTKYLVHLLVDEADLFAPQTPQAGDRPLLGVTENIVRRGRNRGIGCTLITQRPAVLNKDVLTQVDGLGLLRMVGLTDRKAVDEWVKGHGDDEQAAKVKETLASLKNGESWWWIPELGILKRVQIRQSNTFDSSPTRKRGAKRMEPKTFADIDVPALSEKMAATIERAKADDPRELRKEIVRLKKELESRPTETQEVRVEVPFVPKAVTDAVVMGAAADRDVARALHSAAERLEVGAGRLEAGLNAATEAATEVRTSAPPQPKTVRPAPPRPDMAPRQDAPEDNGRVSGSQQRILDALAALEGIRLYGPGRTQVALFAKVSPKSSGFEKNVSTLRTRGYLDFPQKGHLTLTDDGRAIASAENAPQTAEEMQEYVRVLVGETKWNILRILVDCYPEALTREELAERADCAEYQVSATSSGYEKNLSTMKSLGLITYPGRGLVVALPVLFLEGA